MGIVLKVTKPLGRNYFTSAETISGTVEWKSSRPSTVLQIVLYLEGKLKVALRPLGTCQESGFRKSERVLFVHQKVVHPSGSTQLSAHLNSSGSDTQVLNFSLEFPAVVLDGQNNTLESKSGLSSLPLSFSVATDVLQISVSYTLRVVLEKTGRFSLNNTARCNVEFRPLSVSEPCPRDRATLLKTVTYFSIATLGVKEHALAGGNGLPPYIPSIALEVDLPLCQTIFPGGSIKLGITLVIPAELRSLLALTWVTRLTIRLRATTTAILGSQRRTHTGYIDCCSITGSMPLDVPSGEADDSRVVLPSELWQNHAYPHLLPSFKLAGAQRTHELEIMVDFACVSTNNVHSIVTRINVFVEGDTRLPLEAPPEYD